MKAKVSCVECGAPARHAFLEYSKGSIKMSVCERCSSVVPQDTVLFNDTIFYNIAYAGVGNSELLLGAGSEEDRQRLRAEVEEALGVEASTSTVFRWRRVVETLRDEVLEVPASRDPDRFD